MISRPITIYFGRYHLPCIPRNTCVMTYLSQVHCHIRPRFRTLHIHKVNLRLRHYCAAYPPCAEYHTASTLIFQVPHAPPTVTSPTHLQFAVTIHHLASSPFAGRMHSTIHVDTATPAEDDPVRTSSVVARNSPGRGIWAYHGFLARILEKKCRGMFFIQVWFPGQDLCDGNASRRRSPTTRDAVTTRWGPTKTYINKRLTAMSRRRRNTSVLL